MKLKLQSKEEVDPIIHTSLNKIIMKLKFNCMLISLYSFD